MLDRTRELVVPEQVDRLARVEAFGLHELVAVSLQRIGDPEQQQAALTRSRVPPRLESARRRVAGCVDVVGPGQRRFEVDLATGRIDEL